MTPLLQSFEHASDSVIIRTIEGRIDFWNHSAEDLYGWRKEEAIGRISHNLLQTQFPKPLEEIESELVRNGRWNGKLMHTTRSGARVVVTSHWTLEPKEQCRAVVEINMRSTDREMDLEGRANSYGEEVATQEPTPASKKLEHLLISVANIVLAGGAFLCLLVTLYFLYHYGWTAERHVTSAAGMVLYSVFPAVLSCLLFGFLRWRTESKINAAIFCLATFFSVYGAEAFLTFWNSTVFPPGPIFSNQIRTASEKNEVVKLAAPFGVNFDTRSKLEVITDLRSHGVDAVPAVSPQRFLTEQQDGALRSIFSRDGAEMLPLAGIANKVTVFCNETGEHAIYESDEHGFHNPRGIWNSNRLDIAAVGDSFTNGACVRSDKNFVSVIRQSHPRTLNLGMASYGPLFTLAALKEYLPQLKPKIVLWFYFEGNDPEELEAEQQSALLMRYLEGRFQQGLASRQPEIDQALAEYVKTEAAREAARQEEEEQERKKTRFSRRVGTLLTFIKLSTLRQQLGLVYGDTVEKTQPLNVALLRDILLQARASVNAWGGRFYLVYLPAWERYGSPDSPIATREPVLTLANDLNIPTIDLHPVFRAQSDPLSSFPFRRFGHYNEQGHRLVAETVLQAIQSDLPLLREHGDNSATPVKHAAEPSS